MGRKAGADGQSAAGGGDVFWLASSSSIRRFSASISLLLLDPDWAGAAGAAGAAMGAPIPGAP